jgi:hypothetical protein
MYMDVGSHCVITLTREGEREETKNKKKLGQQPVPVPL